MKASTYFIKVGIRFSAGSICRPPGPAQHCFRGWPDYRLRGPSLPPALLPGRAGLPPTRSKPINKTAYGAGVSVYSCLHSDNMAERIRLRIRATVIIDIIPENNSSPSQGGSSSSSPRMDPIGTPRMLPLGTARFPPPPRFPSPPPVQPLLPGQVSHNFAGLLGVLNNEPRVDPSELTN